MPSELREQLQSTLGSVYTLEREFGGGGVARDLVLRTAQISGWSR